MRRRVFIGGLSALCWAGAAYTQQPDRSRRLAVLMGYAEGDPESQRWIQNLMRGLNETNWTVGKNIEVEYRWAGGAIEKLRAHATELIALKPDVVLAASTPALSAIRQQVGSVPIVFVNVADPIGQGFVSSFARPGGNITGFTSGEFSMGSKWIELLKEISPSLVQVAVLVHPDTAPYFPLYRPAIEAAASKLGIRLIPLSVRDTASLAIAIQSLEPGVGTGLIVVPSAFVSVHRDLIIRLAAQNRIPAIYGWNYYATSGGLISYGIFAPDLFYRSASYIDKIFKGAKPEDLPIQQPIKFELVVNLKTATALGLDVPLILQQRADEVIE